MEFAAIEIAVLEEATVESAQAQVTELADLHLAFVGGGGGEVVFA